MKRYTLSELSSLVGAELKGDPSHEISGVDTLEDAKVSDASFLSNPRYKEVMKASKAGVICVSPDSELIVGKNFLISPDPSRSFQKIVETLLSVQKSGFSDIHPTAVIHETASIGEGVSIGPYAVIDRGSVIGSNTKIGPHVSIGFDVKIGEDCLLHPGSIIRERCELKNRVILQPGAVIGSCGFGYVMNEKGHYLKLEQLGVVILEDDVEIGANTTVDRARFKTTIIRRGSKIDNLVQIAHNVEIGEDNVIASQTGIAGSSKTGRHVMMGGQVGVLGHVEIQDRVQIATRGGVSKSLKEGKYRGSPAIPIHQYHRQEVHVRKLEEYVRRLKELEKKMELILPLS